MKVRLTYKYSELDKEHQFGLTFTEYSEVYEMYVRWIYFHLGRLLGNDKITIYQFDSGKVVKEYKYCNDAERQASLVFNKIKSIK